MEKKAFLFFVLTAILTLASAAAVTKPDPEWDLLVASRIDSVCRNVWSEKGITPSSLSSDEEFVRRIYLDLAGRIPTPLESREFLAATEPQKREQLIRRLLGSNDFAHYFASQFAELFLGYEKERFVNRRDFQDWWQHQFSQNVSWDQITRYLLTAEGTLGETPPLNWYAKHRLDAANLADDTARNFLGIQLGCARCHNHPHDRWKLEDFYGIAAFYSGLRREELSNSEKKKYQRLQDEREKMVEKYQSEKGAVQRHPQQARRMAEELRDLIEVTQDRSTSIRAEIKGESKTYPAKFLLEPQPAHLSKNKRDDLASWITSPNNPFYAKAFVNRIWAMLMGSGFINPVDDMGGMNSASNPEMLEFLSVEFINHQYDIKYLLYTITNSQPYQLSSKTASAEPAQFYERGKVKMLNADQLLNSFIAATGIEEALRLKNPKEYEDRLDMIRRYHVFLFDNDDQSKKQEFGGTIPQALFLLNGKMTNEAVHPQSGNTMTRILSESKDPGERISGIYAATLSRAPSPDELKQTVDYISSAEGEDVAYEDVFWSLLNSNEFLFNH